MSVRWLTVATLVLGTTLGGCGWTDMQTSPGPAPYLMERAAVPPAETEERERFVEAWETARASCDLPPHDKDARAPAAALPIPLSRGDTVRLSIPAGESVEGLYTIGQDGYLRLPLIAPVRASGQDADSVARDVKRSLVDAGIFRPGFARVDLAIIQYAAADVTVAGAVFQPGLANINNRTVEERTRPDQPITGDVAGGRDVAAALRAAGGARPDADLSRIEIHRDGRVRTVDLTGLVGGYPTQATILIGGDHVVVPSRGCIQHALMRPSPVTPPGIRVFMSNLTQPASSNAQSAIGKDSTNFPYGTRMLQGLVAANCVGGVRTVNAHRHGILISRNPLTDRTEITSRPIETLVHDEDRDAFNPVLLPNDAIACYDSDFVDVRDLITSVGQAVGSITLLGILGLSF